MDPFTTALIKAPKRAQYDFSHDNSTTVAIGEGVPTLKQFIVPGDEVSLSMEQICRVAPMPVPTFVPLKVRHDFFFVPLRLLYGQDYMDKLFGATSSGLIRSSFPNLRSLYGRFSAFSFGVNADNHQIMIYRSNARNHRFLAMPLSSSLFDYLGYPVLTDRNGGISDTQLAAIASGNHSSIENAYSTDTTEIYDSLSATDNVLLEPIIAYHFIWRDWYRFTGIEDNTVIEPYLNNGCLSEDWVGTGLIQPSAAVNSVISPSYITEGNESLTFGDLGLKFRVHAKKDMFMSARYGNKPTVLIPTGSNGTIPALREASAIQRFLDIISITGQRYFDKVKGLFGVEPQGPKDDRVQFLGRYSAYVKVGEVITTASTEQAVTGDYAGRGVLVDGKYIFSRRFTEHGWLFCISSVVPEVAYSGLGRDLTDVNPLDTPIPVMAQVGDQSILCREVSFQFRNLIGNSNPNNSSFGDQFRYYSYKSANNEVHGSFLMESMRPWSPLAGFVTETQEGSTTIVNTNVISYSRIKPEVWNYLFNDTDFEPIWGDRFFMNLNFSNRTNRALPKYINYHL